MKRLEIGIAGAGIGGLAAAAGLAQAGHKVRIFDRFDEPRPVGSGLVIQPVGQAVLEGIGAAAMAHDLGQPIERMIGHEAQNGRRVLDVFYDLTDTNTRFGLALHRSALFQAVLDAAEASGAELIAGHDVVGVTQGPKRQIRFTKGRESPRFDLVIDAAGAGSELSPLVARRLPYGAIWGTVDWPEDTGLKPNWLSQSYRAASRMAGVLPIGRMPGGPKNKAAIFWSLTPQDFEHWNAAPIEHWKDAAAAFWPDFAPFLTQITDHAQMTPAFYSHGTIRDHVRDGLVHIGDAAHRASPQLGQGANMALLDAAALCAALTSKRDLQYALQRYVQMRKRHLWLYQLTSAAFTPLYQSDSRWLPRLRDHVLTPLSRVPPMPRILSRLVCGDLAPPIRS